MKNQTRTVIWCTEPWCKYIVIQFVILALLSCRPSLEKNQDPDLSIPPVVNHFDEFYQAFHEDTSFQSTHIHFPLEGEPEQSDTQVYMDTYYWQLSHWVWHKPFNAQDTLFSRHFEIMDPSWIIETIAHRMSPMRLERRYSFDGSEWSLIYYSPLRMPVKIQIN